MLRLCIATGVPQCFVANAGLLRQTEVLVEELKHLFIPHSCLVVLQHACETHRQELYKVYIRQATCAHPKRLVELVVVTYSCVCLAQQLQPALMSAGEMWMWY